MPKIQFTFCDKRTTTTNNEGIVLLDNFVYNGGVLARQRVRRDSFLKDNFIKGNRCNNKIMRNRMTNGDDDDVWASRIWYSSSSQSNIETTTVTNRRFAKKRNEKKQECGAMPSCSHIQLAIIFVVSRTTIANSLLCW